MGRGTIHHENMQALATEMFKVFTGISPKIITNHGNELWRNYNLRHQPGFSVRPIKNVYFGTNSLSYLRSKICDIVPAQLKKAEYLGAFKSDIAKWNQKITIAGSVRHASTRWALFKSSILSFYV